MYKVIYICIIFLNCFSVNIFKSHFYEIKVFFAKKIIATENYQNENVILNISTSLNMKLISFHSLLINT